MEKKFCPECNLYLDITKFKKLTTKGSLERYPDGYYWCCSECYKAKEWVYRAGEEPNNRKARRRDKRARRIISVESVYGLLEQEYLEKIREQENLCAICHKKDEGKVLCIDHNHKSGEVRGLLCHNCNIGLGNFKDNPEILEAAIGYLKKYQ